MMFISAPDFEGGHAFLTLSIRNLLVHEKLSNQNEPLNYFTACKNNVLHFLVRNKTEFVPVLLHSGFVL